MTTLIAALILADTGSGVNNIKETGPQAQHDAVRDVAKMVGMSLFAPDKTARGFTMRSIEMAKLSGGELGMTEGYAVRMRFINKNTSTAFDIYQMKSSGSVDATKHMNWLFGKGVFEGGVSKHDTYVSLQRGGMDLAFVGGLVSEPSAKELLKRFVKISP